MKIGPRMANGMFVHNTGMVRARCACCGSVVPIHPSHRICGTCDGE